MTVIRNMFLELETLTNRYRVRKKPDYRKAHNDHRWDHRNAWEEKERRVEGR